MYTANRQVIDFLKSFNFKPKKLPNKNLELGKNKLLKIVHCS